MNNKPKTIITIFFFIGIIAFGYLFWKNNWFYNVINIIDENTPAPIFIVLLLILPALGFPASIFFVLTGIKFGILVGLLLMLISVPVHLILSFFMVKLFRSILKQYLLRKNYKIPTIREGKQIRYSFLVFVLPVFPYAIKNIFLPMTGTPFLLYFGMGWICHSIFIAPIVILGSSAANLNFIQFVTAIVCIMILFFIIAMFEKKYSKVLQYRQHH